VRKNPSETYFHEEGLHGVKEVSHATVAMKSPDGLPMYVNIAVIRFCTRYVRVSIFVSFEQYKCVVSKASKVLGNKPHQ
jgi:hypothetical protein